MKATATKKARAKSSLAVISEALLKPLPHARTIEQRAVLKAQLTDNALDPPTHYLAEVDLEGAEVRILYGSSDLDALYNEREQMMKRELQAGTMKRFAVRPI